MIEPPAAPPEAPTVVEEVVVTAARLPPGVGEAVFAVTPLATERLAASGRVDEALTATPGVSLFRRTTSGGANPTTQGLSLRAIAPSGAGRALVTLDGVPLNDPFGGWVVWSQLPPEAVEGGQIIRGAGAGPYGAGALTGVIALRERDAGAVADLGAAERGGLRLGAAGARGRRGANLFGALLAERTDGYVPVRGPDAGAADTPLELETLSGAARVDLGLPGGAALSARAGAWRETRGSGLQNARAEASGSVASLTLARPPLAGRWGWRLQAWRRESDLYNSSAAVAPDRSGTTPAAEQHATPAEGWGANAALRRAAGDWEWELGADARISEGETRERFRFMDGAFTRDRRAGGRASVAGAYLEGAWRAGPWLAAGGVRLDSWRNADGRRLERDRETGAVTLDLRPEGAEGEVATARLGVSRQTAFGTWRAAAYAGFRPPTLNELHRPFRVGNDITEANAALAPERLQGAEVGWSGGDVRLAWSATLFWNRLQDAIVNVTIGEGQGVFPVAGFVPAGGVLRQRRNAGTIEAVGLEAELAWRPDERLELGAAAAFTEAEVDGGDQAPQLTGLRPAQAPRWSATARARWQAADRLALSGEARLEGRRFDDDLNSRVLDAAVVLDARADWRLRDGVALYLAVDNLADAEAEVSETAGGVAGYGPPRTVRAGVRASF